MKMWTLHFPWFGGHGVLPAKTCYLLTSCCFKKKRAHLFMTILFERSMGTKGRHHLTFCEIKELEVVNHQLTYALLNCMLWTRGAQQHGFTMSYIPGYIWVGDGERLPTSPNTPRAHAGPAGPAGTPQKPSKLQGPRFQQTTALYLKS